MDLEQRQLRHLLAIARGGSFSVAARDLLISQPALSASIAQLESHVGGKLFERGRHGAVLTPLGTTLLRHAEIIETQMRRAAEELRQHRQHVLGPLNLAVTPVAAAYILPRAIGQLKVEFPDVTVQINETVVTDHMAGLRRGSIDVSLGPMGVYPAVDNIVEERLSSDVFRLIARAGSPLLKGKQQTLRALADRQWVLPSDESAYRHQLEALFIVGGVPWPTRAVLTNSMVAIKTIVMHSDCIAIMPQQLVQLEVKAGVLKQNSLEEAGTTRGLGLAYSADRPLTPLAQRFVDILREQSRRQAPPNAPPRRPRK